MYSCKREELRLHFRGPRPRALHLYGQTSPGAIYRGSSSGHWEKLNPSGFVAQTSFTKKPVVDWQLAVRGNARKGTWPARTGARHDVESMHCLSLHPLKAAIVFDRIVIQQYS